MNKNLVKYMMILLVFILFSTPSASACSYYAPPGPELSNVRLTKNPNEYLIDVSKQKSYSENETEAAMWNWVDDLDKIVLDTNSNSLRLAGPINESTQNYQYDPNIEARVTPVENTNRVRWEVILPNASVAYSIQFYVNIDLGPIISFYSQKLNHAFLIYGELYSDETSISIAYNLETGLTNDLSVDLGSGWISVREIFDANQIIELNAGCCFCVNSYLVYYDTNSFTMIYEDNVFNSNIFDLENNLIFSVDRFHDERTFEVLEKLAYPPFTNETWEFTTDDLKILISTTESDRLIISAPSIFLPISIIVIFVIPRKFYNRYRNE
ncbi:MAG: hypothetical protein ACW99A_22920 [Candidatus Kariarchaeaceae archaeon]|jgi:hypothetical protein